MAAASNTGNLVINAPQSHVTLNGAAYNNVTASTSNTTLVVEEGVTIANLQVIIFKADHDLYDEGSLIQISGRVGRKFYAPDGEVIFLASKISDAMENAIKTIKEKNKDLQNLL